MSIALFVESAGLLVAEPYRKMGLIIEAEGRTHTIFVGFRLVLSFVAWCKMLNYPQCSDTCRRMQNSDFSRNKLLVQSSGWIIEGETPIQMCSTYHRTLVLCK